MHSSTIIRQLVVSTSVKPSALALSRSGTHCHNCRSAELLSTFKRNLKAELLDIAYCKREHSG